MKFRQTVKAVMVILTIFLSLAKVTGQTGKEVNLASFLQKDSKDATSAVRSAIAYCLNTHATKLVIPKGKYEFWPDQAIEQYMFTSNNDEGLKRIVFLLDGMNNFEVDAQGAEFIFHGFVSPFVLKHCKNIRLHGFSIDWTRTFHSEGKIVTVDNEGMELNISPAYPYKIVNERLVFYGEDNVVYPYGGLLEFDPVKRETAYMAQDYWTNSDLRARELAPGHIKIFREGMKGTPGNIMTFAAAGRMSSAIVVSDSRNIKVDSATIFHCGGMGVIAQRSSDITVDHVNVTPSNGRAVSITADATHFANCTGHITLSNCLFENQLDDATNIHGIYVQIIKKISSTAVLVALKHPQQLGFDFIKPNATMELVHSNSLISYGQAEVQSVERLNKEYTIVHFKKALPATLVANDVIADVAGRPLVNITNCIIRGNRARGILLGSRGKITIEKNMFHNAGASILFEGDGVHWFEQAGVKDVSITDNVFDNCNYGVWGNAVIQVGSGIDPESRSRSRYNSNIMIEKNIFKMFDPRLINAYSVDNLIFKNNTIEYTKAYPSSFPAAKPFEIKDCDRVAIDAKGEDGLGIRN